jgi:hypothetical protein
MKPTRVGGTGPHEGRKRILTGRTVTYRLPVLAQGQVECPVCRRPQMPMSNGSLRKHRDLFGHPCGNKGTGLVDRTEQVAEALAEAERAEQERRAQERLREDAAPRKRMPGRYKRTTVTGRCHVCDRPVTGERRLCGPCFADPGRNRDRTGS